MFHGLLRSCCGTRWVQGFTKFNRKSVNSLTVGENNTCAFQFTMLIGIAIEMPFALGEMLLGLEVILRELKIRRNDPFTGLLHSGLEDSSDGFLPAPARWRSIPWHSSLYRFGRTMVGCSRICALVGWGWKNKGSKLYCQV